MGKNQQGHVDGSFKCENPVVCCLYIAFGGVHIRKDYIMALLFFEKAFLKNDIFTAKKI